MQSFGFRRTVLFAIVWVGIGSTVRALGHHGDTIETAYVMPSSVSLPVTTSYVVSTSWVGPTTYAVPTYYTTAYWMDPVVLAQPTYATTAFVRRGLLGRRWIVERPLLTGYTTAIVPTTYIASPVYRTSSNTVSDPGVVRTSYLVSSDCICPTSVASSAPVYGSPSRDSSVSGTGSGSRTIQSEPSDRSSMRSDVGAPPENLNAIGTGRGTGTTGTNARETIPSEYPPGAPTTSGVPDSPPTPPRAVPPPEGQPTGTPSGTNPPAIRPSATPPANTAPTPGATTTTPNPRTSATTGGPGTTGNPQFPDALDLGRTGRTGTTGSPTGTGTSVPAPAAPTAPSGVDPGPPPLGPSGDVRRESMRPSNYGARAVPTEFRNVLLGTVVSRSFGDPEEGVRISVVSPETGNGRVITTDALGRFAVRLAEGEWTVNVTMPSGRVYAVSEIRVADGRITDNLGRRVPSLEITR
jgi:Carboxypeptidase regulatory-like domain